MREPQLRVRGEAVLEVEPEIAHLRIAVGARDRDRRTVLDRVTRRNDEVLTLIKSYGEAVESVETGGFSVYPETKGRRADERIRGYHGTVRLRVVVNDFTALGEIVTRLADQDLVTVDGLTWAMRATSDIHRRARAEAAREAVKRAAEYAEALGGRLTGLIELTDTGGQRNTPMFAYEMDTMRAMGDGPPALTLEPQTQSVHAEVEAHFTMTPPQNL
ncbi:SIMPL domain-containing protein [Rhizohabitans arisaemae]|uniref:SIMPL domain-containing protein n=1 Tax=Rhizohabitans arisaemae TaxID=2720610 RepID=UPI0024B0ACDD|nr:SIMPL domain-containing protein [Rhizohabitans arisaemae]